MFSAFLVLYSEDDYIIKVEEGNKALDVIPEDYNLIPDFLEFSNYTC